MNGQTSSGNNIEAALPQNFIRLPLLFLIYRNNLFDKLAFKPKHFLKTSLFFVVQDLTTKTKDLNNGLNQTKNSNNFPWKMNFIPDPSKQVPEVMLPQKKYKKRSCTVEFLSHCQSNRHADTFRDVA